MKKISTSQVFGNFQGAKVNDRSGSGRSLAEARASITRRIEVIVTSGGTLTHATTIALQPQTINGTIAGVSSSG
jgi:hypothetical protein